MPDIMPHILIEQKFLVLLFGLRFVIQLEGNLRIHHLIQSTLDYHEWCVIRLESLRAFIHQRNQHLQC